jgi:hypothetical protein
MKIYEFYKNEEVLKELKPYIEENKVTLDKEWLFVKDEYEKEIVEKIINKYDDYCGNAEYESLEQFIESFDCGYYINIRGMEFYKSECIDSLKEKIKENEEIVNRIFEYKNSGVVKYIENLVDLELATVIENEIKEMKQLQKDIINGEEIKWR